MCNGVKTTLVSLWMDRVWKGKQSNRYIMYLVILHYRPICGTVPFNPSKLLRSSFIFMLVLSSLAWYEKKWHGKHNHDGNYTCLGQLINTLTPFTVGSNCFNRRCFTSMTLNHNRLLILLVNIGKATNYLQSACDAHSNIQHDARLSSCHYYIIIYKLVASLKFSSEYLLENWVF